jgi:hydroxymethylpyrimidine kinase/phosphomethylpyrimidine kinase
LIRKLGAKNVVIKGGHLPRGKRQGAIDVLYDGVKYYEYSAAWIESQDTHGTGCTYASVLAANLALGGNIITAAEQAKIMVTAAIENAWRLGKGHGPVNVLGKDILTGIRNYR